MSFTSYIFIAFLVVMFAIYYIIPKKWQWLCLLVGSYVFYAWAGPKYLIYLVVTTVTTWFAARRISKGYEKGSLWLSENRANITKEQKKAHNAKVRARARGWFLAALFLNLGILAVVKYADFAIGNVNAIFGTDFSFLNIALPMGLSFYMFQSLGYLIDVKNKKFAAQDSILKYALFVSFFPQMIQGPISRYDDLSKTLYEEHTFSWRNFSFGVQRILWGFFKKMVIADRLAPAVAALIQSPEQYTGVWVVVAMVFYAAQLYADFTGGIDITIGVAQIFGVEVTENFQRPFFSKNVAEYWRRWHITMGTWFRDYIFYPVSVSRWMLSLSKWSRKHLGSVIGKRVPVYLSLGIVWFATGIWHGAAWNYIVWGMLNALILVISQEFNPLYDKFHKRFDVEGRFFWRLFQIIRTFALMSSIRILDCYQDVPLTFRQIGTIFTTGNAGGLFTGGLMGLGLTVQDYIVLIAGVVLMFIVSLAGRSGSVRDKLSLRKLPVKFAIFAALFFGVLVLGAYGIGYDATQFIYNQF